MEDLRKLIFPGYFGDLSMCEYTEEYYIRDLVSSISHNLRIQVERALAHADDAIPSADSHIKAAGIVDEFLGNIPAVRGVLKLDVDAFFDGDPAAESIDEIIISYPGIYAVTVHRLAHLLWELKVPLLPRIMSEKAHSKTGIDIHPGANIGRFFFLDHGTGIVVGETSNIGDNVKIYQGVTLGAHSTKGGRKLSGNKRHPTIEDNVTIYSGASILGGDTVIGEGSVIGSNAFITSSVPANSRITR
jgi:serine O-acetyltransferase